MANGILFSPLKSITSLSIMIMQYFRTHGNVNAAAVYNKTATSAFRVMNLIEDTIKLATFEFLCVIGVFYTILRS